jgi:hypothetical protein
MTQRYHQYRSIDDPTKLNVTKELLFGQDFVKVNNLFLSKDLETFEDDIQVRIDINQQHQCLNV